MAKSFFFLDEPETSEVKDTKGFRFLDEQNDQADLPQDVKKPSISIPGVALSGPAGLNIPSESLAQAIPPIRAIGSGEEAILPSVGGIAGGIIGSRVGRPDLGYALGTGAGEATKIGIKKIKSEIAKAANLEDFFPDGDFESEEGISNLVDAGKSVGASMLSAYGTAKAFNVLRFPFIRETTNKGIKVLSSKLKNVSDQIEKKAASSIMGQEIDSILNSGQAKLLNPNGLVARIIKNLSKDVQKFKTQNIPFSKARDISQRLNGLIKDISSKRTLTANEKEVFADIRANVSRLLDRTASKSGFPQYGRMNKDLSNLLKMSDRIGGGADVGVISALGSLGALVGTQSGQTGLGAALGALGGASLANPYLRQSVFQGLESGVGQALRKGARLAVTDIGTSAIKSASGQDPDELISNFLENL